MDKVIYCSINLGVMEQTVSVVEEESSTPFLIPLSILPTNLINIYNQYGCAKVLLQGPAAYVAEVINEIKQIDSTINVEVI